MNITKEMPNAQYPFLRFQIGRNEKRYEQIPVLDSHKRLIAFRTGTELVPVFHLIGYGSTLALAQRRAQRAEARYGGKA